MISSHNLVAEAQPQASQRKDVLLLLLLAISLTLNVFLGWKVNSLDISQKKLLANDSLSIGDVVPSILATKTDGGQEIINFRDVATPTVLYVITPECVWCERNFFNANTLAKNSGKAVRFIGLSLTNENLKTYIAERHPAFPIYANLSQESISKLKLGSTPQTIVISPNGLVIKNWIGAYRPPIQLEVELYFQIKLPGIAELR